jgi:hypothetical protein
VANKPPRDDDVDDDAEQATATLSPSEQARFAEAFDELRRVAGQEDDGKGA